MNSANYDAAANEYGYTSSEYTPPVADNPFVKTALPRETTQPSQVANGPILFAAPYALPASMSGSIPLNEFTAYPQASQYQQYAQYSYYPEPISYVAPTIPDPPKTTYIQPNEVVHMRGWWKGYGYSATLKDTARNPWWTPFATTGIWFALFQVLSLGIFVILAFMVSGQEGIGSLAQNYGFPLDPFGMNDSISPILLVLQFGSIAVMLPALWWALKIMKRQSFGSISSVFGHLRWAALLRSTIIAFTLFIILNFVSIAIDLASGVHYQLRWPSLLTIFLAITVVPIQCASEEYIFRGLLLQGFGRWIPRIAHILVPIIPAIIFTSLHSYELLELTAIFSLGLLNGYLAMYLGGLEAGIGIHIANNVSIVLFQSFGFTSGTDTPDLTSRIIAVAIDIALQLIFVAIIVWGAKKRGWFDNPGPDYGRMLYDHVSSAIHRIKEKYDSKQRIAGYHHQMKTAAKRAAWMSRRVPPQVPQAPSPSPAGYTTYPQYYPASRDTTYSAYPTGA
ncbi:CPBP family intramembrane metalloprotease [Alloscardovia theropitheci]|uniref:CPBP family intramembrane metalloprotease n=1 Tax=Alloscardovia theropitheci TaxID=2496842 RepID=A0A4R0QPS6_9BIFI|nr:CPBP family intramembrane glutamic endopeptidase [Alloscardovia theropitheci]TCD54254.1 CPBP family intramembrane metalloprotease [Alloscardovia theropitheci]